MNKNMKNGLLLLVFAVSSLAFLSGCSSVSPWQKGVLADPTMKFVSEQDSNTYEQHMLNAREASSGGYGGSGGGCGCK